MRKNPKCRCVELATKSTFRTRHGCVVVHGGKIIGSGFNINLKHPMIKQFNELKTLHAEMIAIMRVKNKRLLKDSALFVTRISPKGKSIMSKPCCICMNVIKSFGVKDIYYTNEDGNWVKLIRV